MRDIPHLTMHHIMKHPERYQTSLPMMFDDTLTQLQKMNRLMAHLKAMDMKLHEVVIHVESIGNIVDENIKEMLAEIKQFEEMMVKQQAEFEGNMMDYYMPTSVEIILNQWLESGKLNDIINNEVLHYYVSLAKMKTVLINEFPRLDNETDDQARFDRAIASIPIGGVIVLEANTVYLLKQLRLPSLIAIIGQGYTTSLMQLPHSEHFIKNAHENTVRIAISNCTINGNAQNQTTRNHGVFMQQGLNVDPESVFHNLFITNTTGIGLALIGRGEHRVDNVFAMRCNGSGFYIGCSDSNFSNLTAGFSGEIGIYVDGSNNKIVNAKAYCSGYKDEISVGVLVRQSRNMLSNVESQENAGHGLEMADGAHLNIIDITTDANGWNSKTEQPQTENKYGVAIGNNVHSNIIKATGADFQKTNLNKPRRQHGGLLIYGSNVHSNEITMKMYDLEESRAQTVQHLKQHLANNQINITHVKKDNSRYTYGMFEELNKNGEFTPELALSPFFKIESEGYYNRNGGVVHVAGRIRIVEVLSTPTTEGMYIEGLPFQALDSISDSSIMQSISVRVRDEDIPEAVIGGVSNNGYGFSVMFDDGKTNYLPLSRLKEGSVINFTGSYLAKE